MPNEACLKMLRKILAEYKRYSASWLDFNAPVCPRLYPLQLPPVTVTPPSASTPHRPPATHLVQLVGLRSSGALVTRHPPLFVLHGLSDTSFQALFSQDGYSVHLVVSMCAVHIERRPEEPLRSAKRNNWGSSDPQGNPQNLNALTVGGLLLSSCAPEEPDIWTSEHYRWLYGLRLDSGDL